MPQSFVYSVGWYTITTATITHLFLQARHYFYHCDPASDILGDSLFFSAPFQYIDMKIDLDFSFLGSLLFMFLHVGHNVPYFNNTSVSPVKTPLLPP